MTKGRCTSLLLVLIQALLLAGCTGTLRIDTVETRDMTAQPTVSTYATVTAAVAAALTANPTVNADATVVARMTATYAAQPTANMDATVSAAVAATLTAAQTIPPSATSPVAITSTTTPAPGKAPAATPVPLAPGPTNCKAGDTQTRKKDGMVMVCVPAGPFLMGSTSADSEAADDEKPQHTVTLDGFLIDKTEVTNAQYQKCVAAGVCRVADMASYDPQDNPNHPVVEVTWNDAQIYCHWAGARLPTEAEWEKAARGTDGRLYPWGNQAPDCTLANYWGKHGGCVGNTMPVGSYPTGASPYGLLDMAGNAWEWIADWYAFAYYGASPERNPAGPESGRYRIIRGGSWTSSSPSWCIRSANRNTDDPSLRGHGVGFRCVVVESRE